MVEFRTEYYTPMDRGYHAPAEFDQLRPAANIEEPIIPIAQLGQTVPEHDPSGRFKNILQNVQAAIRAGTGNLQIVFQTPLESAIGGRPKAYGEEVRKAIREVAQANEVMITGMEMPTSLTNMSGWDPQRGVVDDEKRQRELDEVKEMVRFAAEVGQGGGVDIVSWEYDRPLHRANWLRKDSPDWKAFHKAIVEEERKEEIRFVDERSGQIIPVGIREGIFMFMDKKTFKPLSDAYVQEHGPQRWAYDDFERFAQAQPSKPDGTAYTVHDAIKEHFLQNQINIAKAERGFYLSRLRNATQEMENVAKQLSRETSAEERAKLEKIKSILHQEVESSKAGIEAQTRTVFEFEERKKNWADMNDYVLRKSRQSYAEAGITAMQLQDKSSIPLKKDLYVGPEIGWPQFYGSHPREFVDQIRGARAKMVDVLTDPKQCTQYGISTPLGRREAEEEAQRHIKGTFDTSHMGMWLQQFHPELPWDQRLPKFKKWYKEQIEWLADVNRKEQVIGAVQAVDSAGAAHGHLPPGQGILPVKDAINILRTKGGFTGYVASEGHEEEKFGEGRILLKTWQHFNAPLTTGYVPGFPQRTWGQIQNAYFGKTYSPLFMFGSYAPSNEFKLWSEVPLE